MRVINTTRNILLFNKHLTHPTSKNRTRLRKLTALNDFLVALESRSYLWSFFVNDFLLTKDSKKYYTF